MNEHAYAPVEKADFSTQAYEIDDALERIEGALKRSKIRFKRVMHKDRLCVEFPASRFSLDLVRALGVELDWE
jgi:hypothetical protein